MRNSIVLVIALSAITGVIQAKDLCAANPYTRKEAELGKVAFESRCALCHQYSMAGRVPGNEKNEVPGISTLSEGDLKFVDGSGGKCSAAVPPAG